ncbi:MAG: cyanophycinase [Cyclobacteriaceae bacterium]|nr:cyanophycinase [Cyclobacteriaceae bacterium]
MKLHSPTFLILFYTICCTACEGQDKPVVPTYPKPANYESIGIAGDAHDVVTTTEAGIVLMGGGTDVDDAFRWMIERSGGGDFVIIRASGSTGYNKYIQELGSVNSVETLLIDNREKAMKKDVGQRIKEAEAVFIAGGDQWNYVNFWKDTEVSSALRFLVEEKKIPIGGTSAGCAILSEIMFDAKYGTVVSAEAISNPFANMVSLSKSFIPLALLQNTVADQHYSNRERLGRHVAFMARMITDFSILHPRGIGVDEKTAVCIDQDGMALVKGLGHAYFISANGEAPEVCTPGSPLQWKRNNNAIRAYIFQGSSAGTEAFNLNHWPDQDEHERWYVEEGVLKRVKP